MVDVVKMDGGDTQDVESGIEMPNWSSQDRVLGLMAPLIHWFRRPLAQHLETQHLNPHTRLKTVTRVAVTNGVVSSEELGAHKAVGISRVRPHYEMMRMTPSNYHPIQNVMNFGGLEMTQEWAWSE